MRKTLIKLLVLVFASSVATCFAVGCGHTHTFDKQVASSDYVSKEATCLEAAEYFYSCECGEKGTETFEYGQPLGHDYSAWVSNLDDTHTRTCSRDASHTETADCLGGTATCTQKAVCDDCDTEYGEKEQHVFDKQVASDDYKSKSASCLKKAKYFYSCICGEKGTETFEYGDPLGHSYSAWKKAYGGNAHSRTCNRCSDGYEYVKCSGGQATCTEQAICDVCKTAYGEPLGHAWMAWESNLDGTHTRTCSKDANHTETKECHGGEAPCEVKSICVDCKTEYGTVIGHDWTAWSSNGNNKHTRYCKNNTKEVQTESCYGGTPTCTDKPRCEGCDSLYGSSLGGHKYGEWTSIGDDKHSRVCENDNSHVETKDCHGGKAPCETQSICDDCHTGYGEIIGSHEYTDWRFYGNDQHYRYCTRTNCGSSWVYEDCVGGTATCIKKAVCDICKGSYGSKLDHVYGEYEEFSDATCTGYGKLRARCTTPNCYAYLEKDDESKPPKGYHTYNTYDRCEDCNSQKPVSSGLSYTRMQGQNSNMLSNLGSCTDTEIVIPQYTGGYFVTKITDEYGRGPFDYTRVDYSNAQKKQLAKITKVTIPATVKYIGEMAFYRLPALETVIIEGNDVVIDANAFYMCEKLKTVIFTGTNIEIGKNAFKECKKLETVEIAGYFSKIGESAFNGCSPLKELDLREGLTELGSYSLGYTAIESVVVPRSVSKVGDGVFGSCKNLRSAIFNCRPTSFGQSMFSSCSSLVKVELPTNLTSIPYNSFSDCTVLAKADIPSGVTSIGSWAFRGTSLTSVTIPKGVTTIESHAFLDCYKLFEVVNKSSLNITVGGTTYGYVGYYAVKVHNGESGVVNANDFLFINHKGENYLLAYVGLETEITLPKDFNGKAYNLYDYAFYKCKALTKITLSDNVLAIGNNAFKDCNANLFNVKDGVNYIGTADNDFYAAIGAADSAITTVAIDNNTKVIADSAFYKMSSKLTTATIPSGLKHFGYMAFYSCSGLTYNVKGNVNYLGDETNPYVVVMGVTDDTLTSYSVENGAKFLGYASFWSCQLAVSINIPSSVVYIEEGAFNFCYELESMVIPYGVTKIPEYCFARCRSLARVEIPETVISIGEHAFDACRELKNIKLPSGLVSLGSDAFYSSGITYIEIPEGVTEIGDFTFYECTSLVSIVIPENVTLIGKDCFTRCGYFKNVYFKGTQEEWNNITIISDTNNYLGRATKYFYVENQEDVPTDGGKYWHYVEGTPTSW